MHRWNGKHRRFRARLRLWKRHNHRQRTSGLSDDADLSVGGWWATAQTKWLWGHHLSPNESGITVYERGQSVQQVLTDEQWFCIDDTNVDGVRKSHFLEGDVNPIMLGACPVILVILISGLSTCRGFPSDNIALAIFAHQAYF